MVNVLPLPVTPSRGLRFRQYAFRQLSDGFRLVAGGRKGGHEVEKI